jgi:hypothetical protein
MKKKERESKDKWQRSHSLVAVVLAFRASTISFFMRLNCAIQSPPGWICREVVSVNNKINYMSGSYQGEQHIFRDERDEI